MKDYVDVLQSSVRCIDDLNDSIGDVNKVMDDVRRVSSMVNDVDQAIFDATDFAESLSLDDEMLDVDKSFKIKELDKLPEVPQSEPAPMKMPKETQPIMNMESSSVCCISL